MKASARVNPLCSPRNFATAAAPTSSPCMSVAAPTKRSRRFILNLRNRQFEMAASYPGYSHRRAVTGFRRAARNAGSAQAMADTKTSRIVPSRRMIGLFGFPATHLAMILFRAKVKARPIRIPHPTLTNVDAKTIRNTWPRCAPSAMRIPNSFVRCATVYDTTLNRPTAASTSAIPKVARPLAAGGSFLA